MKTQYAMLSVLLLGTLVGCTKEEEIRVYAVSREKPASAPGPQAILAAVVPHGNHVWYLKLSGVAKHVEKEKPEQPVAAVSESREEAPATLEMPSPYGEEPSGSIKGEEPAPVPEAAVSAPVLTSEQRRIVQIVADQQGQLIRAIGDLARQGPAALPLIPPLLAEIANGRSLLRAAGIPLDSSDTYSQQLSGAPASLAQSSAAYQGHPAVPQAKHVTILELAKLVAAQMPHADSGPALKSAPVATFQTAGGTLRMSEGVTAVVLTSAGGEQQIVLDGDQTASKERV